MTHSPLLPRLLLFCLAGALALAPAARAQEEDPNSALGKTGSPCFDTSEIEESLALPDPDDAAAELVFGDLPDCPKLCKRAGLACAKQAKLAGACEWRWADDRARFAVKVDCAGKTGALLKECAAEIQEVRLARRATARTRQDAEVTACLARGASCEGKCDVAP